MEIGGSLQQIVLVAHACRRLPPDHHQALGWQEQTYLQSRLSPSGDELYPYYESRLPAGAHSLGALPNEIGHKRLVTRIGYSTRLVGHYFFARVFLQIDPARLEDLLHNDSIELLKDVERVSEALLTGLPGSALRLSFGRAPAITLYIEPKDEQDGADAARGIVHQLLAVLKLAPDYVKAGKISDLVVIRGTILSSLTAIRVRPLISREAMESLPGFHLPTSILDLADLQILTAIVTDQIEVLRGHPFLNDQAPSYVASLVGRRKIRKSYTETFVPDAITAAANILAATQLNSAVSIAIEDNRILTYWRSGLVTHFYPSETPTPYRVVGLASLMDSAIQAFAGLTEVIPVLQQATDRVTALLSNLLSVDATEVNIRLQLSVRTLTYVAIAIAILSLGVTLLPSALHDSLGNWLFGMHRPFTSGAGS